MGAVAEDLFITVVKEDTNADRNTDDSGGPPDGQLGAHEQRLSALSRQVNEQLLLSSRLSMQLNQLDELSTGLKRGEQDWDLFLQNSESERREWEKRLATLEQQLKEVLAREAERDQQFHLIQESLAKLAAALLQFNERQNALTASVNGLCELMEA